MRRVEIINGVKEIITALEDSAIFQVMAESGERAPSETRDVEISTRLLDSLKEYAIQAKHFSPVARKISEILRLDSLESSKMWASFLGFGASSNRAIFYDTLGSVRFATNHLPKIIDLVRQEKVNLSNIGEAPAAQDVSKDRDILSVIVIEDNKRFSTPGRLIEVLEAITNLYEACATMQQTSQSTLSVIACDSGSDKSFDFLGLAKVIECVKEIILSMWDRVVFFREKQFSQRIQLIAESLPIIDQISVLERSQQLSPEQAELLRRKIISGAHKFIEAGGTIPEIETKSHFSPRLLLAPQPKLLVEAPSDSVTGSNLDIAGDHGSSSVEFSDLSEDEKMELARLFAKAKERRDQRDMPDEQDQTEAGTETDDSD